MFNIFKKKKNKAIERDIEMVKLMDEHLDLIKNLGERVRELEDNAISVGKIVVSQQIAIKELEGNLEQLQKLIDEEEKTH